MSGQINAELMKERNLCDELASALGGKADPVRALHRYSKSLSEFKDKVEVMRLAEAHVGGWRSHLTRADRELEFAESVAHGLAADSITAARVSICAAKLAKEDSDLNAALVREVRAMIERLDDHGSRTEKVRNLLAKFK